MNAGAKSSPAERGTAEGGGGGVAGASPCFAIVDDFGPWPLDFVPVAPEGGDDDTPSRPGTLVPTIVGVVLISTILALSLIVAWQWWQA